MANLDGIWDGRITGGKATLLIASGIILIVFIVGVYWTLSPRYEVLFDSLQRNDLTAISAELDRQGFQYKIEEAAIKVPENVLHEARLGIMESGIPVKGAVGYELFDNSDFGMTEFAQRINYQRALEGELTRTIMALEAVKWARVHIVLPEKQLFSNEDKGPTASVTLFVRDGESLEEAQVHGIQRLVASSVNKLESTNVAVLDQNGEMLSSEKSLDLDIGNVNERRTATTEIENHLTEKAREALATALGDNSGNSDVFVNVELDFDKIVKQTENVVPVTEGNNVVKKRESASKTGASRDGNKSSSSSEVEYQLGREVQEVVKATGTIRRLSVALVVPNEIPEDEAESLLDLIKKVVGYNHDRGDQITVSRASKPEVKESNEPSAREIPEAVKQIENPVMPTESELINTGKLILNTPYLWGGLLGLVLVIISLSYLIGKKKRKNKKLTSEQRELLVAELNAWLEQRKQAAE